MTDVPSATLRHELVTALREAYLKGHGVTPALEPRVRAYARALRLEAVSIEKVIIDVKSIVHAETQDHELVFRPRVVGWSVAGYYAGTSDSDH